MASTRRWAVVGLTAVTALTFSTAGCGSGTSGTGGTASPTPADPKVALAKSVEPLTKTAFKFTLKDATTTVTGAVDPAARSATATAQTSQEGVTVSFEMIIVGGDPYLKFDFGPLGSVPPISEMNKKWLHVDPAKLTDPKSLALDLDKADPAGSAALFAAIVTVESAGAGAYRGTIDLTKATDADLVDEDVVKDLGDAAKTVPFEAALDDQGRLKSLKLSVPAAGKVTAQTWEVTFSDYGAPVTVSKPAGATDLSPQMYDLINQS